METTKAITDSETVIREIEVSKERDCDKANKHLFYLSQIIENLDTENDDLTQKVEVLEDQLRDFRDSHEYKKGYDDGLNFQKQALQKTRVRLVGAYREIDLLKQEKEKSLWIKFKKVFKKT